MERTQLAETLLSEMDKIYFVNATEECLRECSMLPCNYIGHTENRECSMLPCNYTGRLEHRKDTTALQSLEC
jgi:hypothetical protein